MKALSRFNVLRQRLEALPSTPEACTRRNMASCLNELRAIKHALLDHGYPAQNAAILLSNKTVNHKSSQRSRTLLAMIYKHISGQISLIKTWTAHEFPRLLRDAALAGCEHAALQGERDIARERLRFALRHIPLDGVLHKRLVELGDPPGAFPFWKENSICAAPPAPAIADAAYVPQGGALLLVSTRGDVYRCAPDQHEPVIIPDLFVPGGRFLRGGECLALYRPGTGELTRLTGTGEPVDRSLLSLGVGQTFLGGCLSDRGPLLLVAEANGLRSRIVISTENTIEDVTQVCVSSPCAIAAHKNALLVADAHKPMLFEMDVETGEITPMAAMWPHGRALALGSDGQLIYLLSREHLVCLQHDNAEPLFVLELLQLCGGAANDVGFDCTADSSGDGRASMLITMTGARPLHALHRKKMS